MASSSVSTPSHKHGTYLTQLADPDSTFLSTMAKKQRCVLKSQPNGLSKEYEISIDSTGNVKAKQLSFFRYSDITPELVDEKIINGIKVLLAGTEYQLAVAANVAKGIIDEHALLTVLEQAPVQQVCEILYQYRLRTKLPMSQPTNKISRLTFQNPVFSKADLPVKKLSNITQEQLCQLAKRRPEAVHALCSSSFFNQTDCDINLILLNVIQNQLPSLFLGEIFAKRLPDQCLMNFMRIKSQRDTIFSLLQHPKLKHIALILIARVNKIQLDKSSSTEKIALPDIGLCCLTSTNEHEFTVLLTKEVWQFFSYSTSFGVDLNHLLSNKNLFKNQYTFTRKTINAVSRPVLIRTIIMSRVMEFNPEAISQFKDVNKQCCEYDIVTVILGSLFRACNKSKSCGSLLELYSSCMDKLHLPHLTQANQYLYIEAIETLQSKNLLLAIQFYLRTADYILEDWKTTFLPNLIVRSWASDDISEQEFLNLLMSIKNCNPASLINKLGLTSKSLLNHPVHFGKLWIFIHWMNEKQPKYFARDILSSMVKQVEALEKQSNKQDFNTEHLACMVATFNTLDDGYCKNQIKKLFQILTVSEITSLLRSDIFKQPIPIKAMKSLYQNPLLIIPKTKDAFFNALPAEQQVLVIRELIAVKGNIDDTELAKELFHSMPLEAQLNEFNTKEFSILASTA
ncbi:MAG: hypothetical protein HAW66_02910 [Shewanella sp.]|nr:hypothetical protein [Shewanella sp.]